MIARIGLGRDSAGLLAYLSQGKAELQSIGHEQRLTGVRPLGLGLQLSDDDWHERAKQRSEAFETAAVAIGALAACRPDLKHRVAHLVLSADPPWAERQSRSQVRRAYLRTLEHVAAKIGLADRCGVAVLHADGHGQARAARPELDIEHLHAVFALPHPDTLRSIAAHRLQARTAIACRDAWQRLNPTLAREPSRPVAVVTTAPDLDEMLQAISRQERERRRRRERVIER